MNYKKIIAGVLAVTLMGSGAFLPADTIKTLSDSFVISVNAAGTNYSCDSFDFDASTGTMTLKGIVKADEVKDFSQKEFVISITAQEGTVFPVSCEKLFFYYYDKTKSIDLKNVNTSNVTSMEMMFYGCKSLTSLDISSFDTSKVTTMSNMFYGCSSLTSLDVSSFDTSKVTTMTNMFAICSSLTSLDVSSFDTSKVTTMSNMFYGCSSLTSLNISNFNTGKVTNMGSMFWDCRSLTSLDLSNFDTSNVTAMGRMFYGCSSLTSLDLSNFDTSNVTNMKCMFYFCSSLKSLDVSSFNTVNVENMETMFSDCPNLASLDVSGFNTEQVSDMIGMFKNCSSLTVLDLSNFDTSNVTDMDYMFSGCSALNMIYCPDENYEKFIANGSLSSIEHNAIPPFTYINYDCSVLSDGTVRIEKYNGSESRIVIPSEIYGIPVSSIGKNAFDCCKSLQRVIIPDGVTSIGDYAFSNCAALSMVVIPSSVKTFGESVFSGSKNAVIYSDAGGTAASYAKNNSVPFSRVEKDFAFTVLSDGTIRIDKYCGTKTEVAIPKSIINNNVSVLGVGLFKNDKSITKVTIPEGVKTISKEAFYYCESLTSVSLPSTVTSIGEYAFWGCHQLSDVTLSDKLESIGQYAFSLCTNLTELTIPASVSNIGDGAFMGCIGLKTVTISDGVKSVGSSAFSLCTGLEKIYIPSSVTSIADKALGGSDSVMIFCDEGSYAEKYAKENNIPYDTEKYAYTVLEDGTIRIDKYNGQGKTIDIPSKIQGIAVTCIGDAAFEDCRSLTSVTIPDGVTSIGDAAFELCDNLTSVTIPDSVTHIGSRAFKSCDKLTAIKLPDGIKRIEDDTFGGSGITSVTIPESITYIGKYAFGYCYGLTEITIPDNVTVIGYGAFDHCTNLKKATLSENLTKTGKSAFFYCPNLTEVTLSESIKTIDDSAFYSCESLASIIIPDGVTMIDRYAFGYTGLKSIVIPASVTTIDKSAFTGCNNLTIKCCKGSYAEKFAAENNIPYTTYAPAEFNGNTMSLGGSISVNFYTLLNNVPAEYLEKTYVEFTVNGKTQTAKFDASKMNGDKTKYGFTCMLNSISMADNINAVLYYYDANGIKHYTSTVYTAQTYLNTAIAKSTNAKMVTLAKTINDYGYYMQKYLSKTNGWTIGKDHVGMAKAYTTASAYSSKRSTYLTELSAYKKTESLKENIEKVNYSLSLDSDTSINVKITPASVYKGSVFAKVDGKDAPLTKQSDGRYALKIANIPAHELSTMHTIEINTAKGTSTYKVSALSFAYDCINAGTSNAERYNAACALYEYYNAAKAYKG